MIRSLLIFVSILLFSLCACGEKIKSDPEDIVVARVGDKVITARDFRRSYEFGLPHLKKGPNRKRSYLDFMIKEMVLAKQGYKLNLDKSERVKKLESDLQDELLVEALFVHEVKDKILIPDEEIREAIKKSKVQWKFRFWFEPDLDFAERVCQAMREHGYAKVVGDILRSNPEVTIKPEQFESRYLTWLEINPNLLEAIKELPIGDISDPIKFNDGYLIFQIVDIRREALSEYNFEERAESYRQILFYRKLKEKASKYISEFMTPKNVVTKGDVFRKFSNALAKWMEKEEDAKNNFLQSILAAQKSDKSFYELNTLLEKPLVTFKDGSWTVREFLERFDPKSLKMDQEAGLTDLRSALSQEIAIKVRDDSMVKEARRKNLHKSADVLSELQMWRDKWVYEESRRYYTNELKIDDTQAREYFKKYRDKFKIRWDDNPKFDENENQSRRLAYIQMARTQLTQKVDSLVNNAFPVVVNQAILDTITTIEFQKTPWSSLQVFKGSSNRLVTPMIDPAWGL